VKHSDWERDIVYRQRNIVFPDTVQNEGRFYRTLLRTNIPLNAVQRLGVAFLGLLIWVIGAWMMALAIAEFRDQQLLAVPPAGFSVLSLILGWKLAKRAAFAGRPARREVKVRGIIHRKRRHS